MGAAGVERHGLLGTVVAALGSAGTVRKGMARWGVYGSAGIGAVGQAWIGWATLGGVGTGAERRGRHGEGGKVSFGMARQILVGQARCAPARCGTDGKVG